MRSEEWPTPSLPPCMRLCFIKCSRRMSCRLWCWSYTSSIYSFSAAPSRGAPSFCSAVPFSPSPSRTSCCWFGSFSSPSSCSILAFSLFSSFYRSSCASCSFWRTASTISLCWLSSLMSVLPFRSVIFCFTSSSSFDLISICYWMDLKYLSWRVICYYCCKVAEDSAGADWRGIEAEEGYSCAAGAEEAAGAGEALSAGGLGCGWAAGSCFCACSFGDPGCSCFSSVCFTSYLSFC